MPNNMADPYKELYLRVRRHLDRSAETICYLDKPHPEYTNIRAFVEDSLLLLRVALPSSFSTANRPLIEERIEHLTKLFDDLNRRDAGYKRVIGLN